MSCQAWRLVTCGVRLQAGNAFLDLRNEAFFLLLLLLFLLQITIGTESVGPDLTSAVSVLCLSDHKDAPAAPVMYSATPRLYPTLCLFVFVSLLADCLAFFSAPSNGDTVFARNVGKRLPQNRTVPSCLCENLQSS